jgi:phage shock protein PspC (stress-responsive transcriptional regulator)
MMAAMDGGTPEQTGAQGPGDRGRSEHETWAGQTAPLDETGGPAPPGGQVPPGGPAPSGGHVPPGGRGEERRLYREPEERKLTGLCGGVADYLGADPTVVRLAAVLLTLSTRAAIVAYLVGAIVVPERPATTPRRRADRQLLPGHWTVQAAGLLLLVLVVGVADDQWWLDPRLLGVGLVGFGVWLLFNERIGPLNPGGAPSTEPDDIQRENPTAWSGQRATVSPEATQQGDLAGPPAGETSPDVTNHKTEGGSPPVPVPPETTSSVPDDSALRAGPQGEVPPPVPPWGLGTTSVPPSPPSPPSSRSPASPPPAPPAPPDPAGPTTPPGPAGRPTLRTPPVPPRPHGTAAPLLVGLALVVTGVIGLLVVTGVVDFTARTMQAAVLTALGVVLVVGAWWGRTRSLIGIGAPLAGALLLVDALDIPLDGDIGERTVLVDEVGDLDDVHEHLAGELILDLRELPETPGEVPTIRAEVAFGRLEVLLPEEVTADVDALVGVGELRGPGVDGGDESGVHVERAFEIAGREGGGRARLDVQVGLGELEIRHA